MIDSNELDRQYDKAERQRSRLQNNITKQEAKDIAYLFDLLINENDFKEPYLSDRREFFFKTLQIKKEELIETPNFEDIIRRLSANYSFFQKIEAICGFSCIPITEFAPIFQKYIYKNEFSKIHKTIHWDYMQYGNL